MLVIRGHGDGGEVGRIVEEPPIADENLIEGRRSVPEVDVATPPLPAGYQIGGQERRHSVELVHDLSQFTAAS